MIHKLKIEPQFLVDIRSGKKTFENRYNDRNYQENDILLLCAYVNGHYTNDCEVVKVTYVFNDEAYCKNGFVTMSIKLFDIDKLNFECIFAYENYLKELEEIQKNMGGVLDGTNNNY